MSNNNDSQQLAWLRICYRERADPKRWPRPATPYRLGLYAAAYSFKIDDYGSHSARWRQLFEDGYTAQLECS